LIAGWLSPVLIGLSLAMLARAHYVLHVLGRGNRVSIGLTWLASVLVAGFWIWRWMT
jgi:hypothetical protein